MNKDKKEEQKLRPCNNIDQKVVWFVLNMLNSHDALFIYLFIAL